MDQNNLNNNQNNPQPASPQPVESVPPVPAPAKSKKSKKLLFVGLIIAVVLVLLGGGSALAYNLWYQNPDKVLSDAVSNLVSRDSFTGDAKLTLDSADVKATVDLSNKMADGNVSVEANANVETEDLTLNIAGNAVYDKDGTVYVKVNNADELLDALIEVQMAESGDLPAAQQAMAVGMMKSIFQPIVDTVNGQWIKIVPEDMAQSSQPDDEMKCVSDAYKMFKDDQAARDELYAAYHDHKFMQLDEKLGSKDGNIGFSYTLDQDAAEEFGKAVEQTKIGKKVAECNKDDATSTVEDDAKDDEQTQDATVKLELWVDRWSHQLAILKLTAEAPADAEEADDAKINLEYTPNYDQDVKIDVPTDAITTDELGKQLEGMFNF